MSDWRLNGGGGGGLFGRVLSPIEEVNNKALKEASLFHLQTLHYGFCVVFC